MYTQKYIQYRSILWYIITTIRETNNKYWLDLLYYGYGEMQHTLHSTKQACLTALHNLQHA